MNHKKNVCINARFLTQKISGVQRFAIELSIRLQKLDPDIVFLSPKVAMNSDLANKLNVVVVGEFTGHLWEQIELPLYLKSHGSPLLINFCNTAPVLYSNKISTIHDLSFYFSEWFSWRFSFLYKNIIPRIARSSRLIFTGATCIEGELSRRFNLPDGKVSLVKSAVSKIFYNDCSSSIYNFEYILVVGSVDPRKNLNRVLEAYSLLNSKEHLVIVGSSGAIFKAGYDPRLVANDRIHFTGYVSDEQLRILYSGAKLFFYPSLYEGFGIPPIEAQACGCPILVSNAASLPEVCGESAIYCDPLSISDMKDKLDLCLRSESLRSRLVEKGYVNVSRFSWDVSANHIVACIKGLL